MRDISALNTIDYNGENIDIISIDKLPKFDIEDYDLFDEKDFKKYIFSIEKICRGSMEYRNMIKFLRENMDMNHCSFYKNVNNIDTYKIKIEIHHEPFSLFDICLIVYNKRVTYGESLDEEEVAKEVMLIHYNLMVGLIPLSETVHELVHNNYLFVPINKVLGNIDTFMDLYHDFIPPETLDLFEKNKEFSEHCDGNIDINGVLSKKYIYIDPTGSYDLPNYTELLEYMENKITNIKEKGFSMPLKQSIEFI